MDVSSQRHAPATLILVNIACDQTSTYPKMSRDSVVITVTTIRARRFGVRIPEGGAKNLSLLQNVQTGSGTHTTSYSTRIGVLSYEYLLIGIVIMTTHLHLASRLWMSEMYLCFLYMLSWWEETTVITHVKGKSVPLQSRGSQRVPGS